MNGTTQISIAPASAIPIADRTEIVRGIQQLVAAGALFEVRVPKLRQQGRNVLMAGYFDDPQQAADEITRLDRLKPDGIYITLNTPDRACRPRGFGLIQPSSTTTSDADIRVVRWIPIDIDPQRPSGTSATDAQLQGARELADRVVVFLRGCGLPDPYRADSGNGQHVLLPCELPPDKAPFIKRLLDTLAAMYNMPQVKIDTTVANPSRIWKIPGTVARKGEHTGEQPHRLARVTQACDRSQLVTEQQLEAWLAEFEPHYKPKRGRPPTRSTTQKPIDVRDFCGRHHLEIQREDSWNGGTRYILSHCAFDENHNGTSAAILQFPSGAVEYKCLHDSCREHHWRHLRQHVGDVRQLPPVPLRPPKSSPGAESESTDAGDDQRVKIEVSNNIAAMVDAVAAVVCTAEADFYSRAGMLVRVQNSEDDKRIRRDGCAPCIAPLPNPSLCEIVTRQCNFGHWKTAKKHDPNDLDAEPTTEFKWIEDSAPKRVIDALEKRGTWPGLRELVGISEAPVLRADGTIWQTTGYDEFTGILYLPSGKFPTIPDGPISKKVAVAAAQRVFDIVQDFPFDDADGGTHRAAWYAALLTLVARPAINGCVPCFIFDANSKGAGKTLLAGLAGMIAYGRSIPEAGYSADDEEQRKCITSSVLAGDRALLLDNLTGPFGGSAIDRAITSTVWKDRLLGVNKNVELPMRLMFFVTGNNVAIQGDAGRRVIPIRLAATDEKPEDRDGFAHPDIRQHVTDNSPQLLADVLTVLAAYIRAGRPKFDLKAFGSFEAWSDTVRNAVYWVTNVDPLDTREGLAIADEGTEMLADLLSAWHTYTQDPTTLNPLLFEVTEKTPFGRGKDDPMPRPEPDVKALAFRIALEVLCNVPRGAPLKPRQISQRLKAYRDRRCTIYVNGKPTVAYLYGRQAGGTTEWCIKTGADGLFEE